MKKPSVFISIHCFTTRVKKPEKVKNPFVLKENLNLPCQGIIPNAKGFVLSFEEAQDLSAKNPKSQECIKNYLIGKDITQGWTWMGSRTIIDFQDWPLEKAMEYQECFEIVKDKVKPYVAALKANTQDKLRWKQNWWKFYRARMKMRQALQPLNRFIVTPRVSKYRLFTMIKNENVLADNAIVCIASNSILFLGVLTSKFHILWSMYHESSLGEGSRYTSTTCFETFPFPHEMF